MSIVIDYPWWFVLFCIVAGLLYSGVLYFRNNKLKDISTGLINLLAILRFLLVTILSFLLLSPLLNIIDREVEKPIVIIAQDNSESILIGKDSTFYRNKYKQYLQILTDKLSKNFDVKQYSFADNVNSVSTFDSLKFNEKQTSFSSLFDELETSYTNRNLGAIIIASDGLYNNGNNPIYASEKTKSPIYTIALGDTTIKKDLVLLDVEHNRLAYLGNEFPLQIVVQAKKLKNTTTTLTIQKGKNTLFTQKINITSDAFTTTIPVYLEAKNIGLQHYKVKLSDLPNEITLSNNERNVFIEVLDSRQKVLLLSNAPHPDIAAIKESIESNQNYEVESFTIDNFNKPLKYYNLIILHSLPNQNNQATKIINEIKTSTIPVWIISGANTILNNDFIIDATIQKTNECEPVLDENFPLFTISDEFRKAYKYFPAVICPYGIFPKGNNNNALFYQRIGMVETQMPLMVFTTLEENKIALFYGEGLWRWRMQDFAAHGNQILFDEFISKTVQYLAVKVDKSFFKISSPNAFYENEHILLKAELYNESYELINEPEINIEIKNAMDKKFNFSFSKTGNSYRLDAGMMPVGEYNYESKVKVGSKLYKQQGVFHIMPLNIESLSTIADHQLLNNISQTHGGELFYINQLDELVGKLNTRDDIKSVSYTHNTLSDLIHLKWIFFLILILLSVEWFVRKRNGLY